MHRGCMSLGNVWCDECHQIIPQAERYLIIEEKDATLHLCVDCSLKKGYARYQEDKGERILTFFPEEYGLEREL